MATETKSGLTGHMRGVAVTTLSGLAGVLAAIVSGYLVGTTAAAASDTRAVFVLAAFVLLQFPVLKAIGVDIDGFSAKDYLYVGFMTFALWFVSFAILLTSEVAL